MQLICSLTGESKVEGEEGEEDDDVDGSDDGKGVEEASNDESWDGMDGTLRPLPFMTAREDIFEKCPELRNNSESVGELLMDFFELYGSQKMGGGAEVIFYSIFVSA